MKKIDEQGLRLCRIQGEVFALSAENDSSGSAVFIRRYMRSDIARRFDSGTIVNESTSSAALIRELKNTYGEKSYGSEKYAGEELYWMGYLYRYWAYTDEMTSKNLYKLIQGPELRKLYYPYHSLDPAQAIARIKEAKRIPDLDPIQRGVIVMRRVRRKLNTNISYK